MSILLEKLRNTNDKEYSIENEDFDLILKNTNGDKIIIPKYEGTSMFWDWLLWQCEASRKSPNEIFMYYDMLVRLENNPDEN